MDLDIGNLWCRVNEHMDDAPLARAGTVPKNWKSIGNKSATSLNLGFIGLEMDRPTANAFRNSQDSGAQEDGSMLILGLGPTPDLYRADNHLSADGRTKDSAVLFGKSFPVTGPGNLELALPDYPSVAVPVTQQRPCSNYRCLPVADEGSTSARKSGGCMPSLLFACSTETYPHDGNLWEVQRSQLCETIGSDCQIDLPQFHLSPEPSAATESSAGGTSDVIFCSSAEQRNNQRHTKRCRFNGCSKGARGASGLCISHGGGQRCKKSGCNKGAESRTAYCKAHGGGRRCEHLGCTKSAEGNTDLCIAHGGGRRCGAEGCSKAARGSSGLCIRHGGGKRCKIEGCTRSAEGQAGLCISHGGGRRCEFPGCKKGAQGSTVRCKAHGGGRRCMFAGCTKGAEGSTPLCKAHGGGKRCMFEGGGVCPKSVHGGTNFCVAHGGGKRCAVPGCAKSARGRTDCCVKHGGGKRCSIDGCGKSAQGRTDFCKAHGGGKRCMWHTGCEKFARGKSGLCAAHGTLLASQQELRKSATGGSVTIGPGLFEGIVPTAAATRGSALDNDMLSSGQSTQSDNGESSSVPAATRSQSLIPPPRVLIPPQVLVPSSMKSSSQAGQQRQVEERSQGFEFFVPEGRVHGGALMSFLDGGKL